MDFVKFIFSWGLTRYYTVLLTFLYSTFEQRHSSPMFFTQLIDGLAANRSHHRQPFITSSVSIYIQISSVGSKQR